MKVLTFSRHFPKGHPKAGQPTYFVEKVWNGFKEHSGWPDSFRTWTDHYPFLLIPQELLKHHTIRAGSRFKTGDLASLRVWSDKPRRSKQIEFAQVEVKKVWSIEISEFWFINNSILEYDQLQMLAKNDGLEYDDFVNWFNIHPKKKQQVFTGQIICWNDSIEY